MEQAIQILIYIHAFLGGVGLISGIASICVQKGGMIHKRTGKLFSIGMIGSSLVSIPISWMPNHQNLFLFLIGVFTIYLVLVGNRALTFKTKEKANWSDKIISGTMLVFSILMCGVGLYGVLNHNSLSALYLFFGGFGFFLTLKDFKFYKNPKAKKNAWLVSHISKIVGAFIASVTAFIVAGLGIESIISWILPTLVGTIYIIYWKRKVSSPN